MRDLSSTSTYLRLVKVFKWIGQPAQVFGLMLSHLVMLTTILIIMCPLLYILLLSTQSPAQYYHFPPRLWPGLSFLTNVRHAWTQVNMGQLLLNSAIISIVVALGKIALSISSSFAFVYFDFRGKSLCFALMLITHMLPLPVRVIPTYILINELGWLNTYKALTIPLFTSTTGVLLFRQFFQTVPTDYLDAARIDGAGPLQFLRHILVPFSSTRISALFLIDFIYMWNEYLWPLIVANTPRTRVIQIGLKQLVATDAAVDWHFVMAGVLIATIPPLIVLICLQNNLVKGMSLSVEK